MAARRLKEIVRKPEELVQRNSLHFSDFDPASIDQRPEEPSTQQVVEPSRDPEDPGLAQVSALCRRMLLLRMQGNQPTNFFIMAEYLKQNTGKKKILSRLLGFGISMEVAIYALLCTQA